MCFLIPSEYGALLFWEIMSSKIIIVGLSGIEKAETRKMMEINVLIVVLVFKENSPS